MTNNCQWDVKERQLWDFGERFPPFQREILFSPARCCVWKCGKGLVPGWCIWIIKSINLGAVLPQDFLFCEIINVPCLNHFELLLCAAFTRSWKSPDCNTTLLPTPRLAEGEVRKTKPLFTFSLPYCFEDGAALATSLLFKEGRPFLWIKPPQNCSIVSAPAPIWILCLLEASRTLVPLRETLVLEVRNYVYLDSLRCL